MRGQRVGVLDIGSNSIRLVVYDHAGRSPIPVFNEKALCGLGRGVTETGNLPVDGMASALINIDRFGQIARAMRVRHLDVVATSAVRDAANGPAFVGELERRIGHPVDVISGDEEARLSALGVLSGFPDADGVVGDLGGGSLELIDVADRRLGAHATMPLGPLRIGEVARGQRRRFSSMIDRHLDTASWLAALKGRTLYAVGGAWRSIARAHMARISYPIEVIHGYAVDRDALSDYLGSLAQTSKKSVRNIPGVSRRRGDVLPTAALVLDRVLARGQPARVVFSAFGLREGCLYDRLTEAEREKDPLLMAAGEIARETNRFAPHPETIYAWLTPLFPDLKDRDGRLIKALCMLSDVAWSEHPSYRGEHGFLRVLRLPVAGLDHADRVFLGLGLLVRYVGHTDLAAAKAVEGLLEPGRRALAIQVGHALRLALTLSGGATTLLRRTRLTADPGGGFSLVLSGEALALLGDVVDRRVAALSSAVGAPIKITSRRNRRS
ncbi:Ppx/GppA family phosphatase [Thalassobaculum fulvum]|uniref:Ppx/GppA family phosphatase n=1 Tax=Thalassobaculum fulvum TaxID=1633335 RepID=UPI00167BB2D6|nr:Ppx/GppA family phosphatase [Thalassobaculum fulvum]